MFVYGALTLFAHSQYHLGMNFGEILAKSIASALRVGLLRYLPSGAQHRADHAAIEQEMISAAVGTMAVHAAEDPHLAQLLAYIPSTDTPADAVGVDRAF